MQTDMKSFDRLSRILFGEVAPVADIKTMAGVREDVTRDHLASALLCSMERVGLIKNNTLVDKNSQ